MSEFEEKKWYSHSTQSQLKSRSHAVPRRYRAGANFSLTSGLIRIKRLSSNRLRVFGKYKRFAILEANQQPAFHNKPIISAYINHILAIDFFYSYESLTFEPFQSWHNAWFAWSSHFGNDPLWKWYYGRFSSDWRTNLSCYGKVETFYKTNNISMTPNHTPAFRIIQNFLCD
jgi:hypothetical protein